MRRPRHLVPVRLVLALALFAATAVVGVGVGRALRGEPDEPAPSASVVLGEPTRPAPDDPAVRPSAAAEFLDTPTRLVPVLEPVAVGFDDEIGEQLLEQAPLGPDDTEVLGNPLGHRPPRFSGATPVSDPAAPPPTPLTTDTPDTGPPGDGEPGDGERSDGEGDDDPTAPADPTGADDSWAGGGPLWWFDGVAGVTDLLGPVRFDPCAGIEPGGPVPDDCPDGYPATLGGSIDLAPPSIVHFGRGHHLSATTEQSIPCPADTPPAGPDEFPMTVFARTPLASAEARVRPYGSSEAWTPLVVPASTPEQVAWWRARHTPDTAWEDQGIVASCINVPRDPTVAYELEVEALDVFGQVPTPYPGFIPIENPDRRPPTTGEVVGLDSTAVVTAWSVAGGMVRMSSRPVRPGGDDDLSCSRTTSVTVTRGSSGPVIPAGLYDPAYDRSWISRIPIPPGGQVVVCATVFPTSNPLRPLATDRLLFSAPTQERPRIVLQGIRRLGSATIEPGLAVGPQVRTLPSCGRGYVSTEPLAPGRSVSIETTIWECLELGLPVGSDGAVDVPIRVSRLVGSGASRRLAVEELAIPIRVRPCGDPAGCGRPREWYEIPIPTADGRLCGTVFGSGGCGDPLPPDGIAVIRVEYPVIAGPPDAPAPGRGTVTLLDQVDATLGDVPRIEIRDLSYLPSATGDPVDQDARLSLIADRPLRLDVRPRPQGTVESGVPAECATPVGASVDEFVDTFDIRMTGFCAGITYGFPYTATDEAGNVFEFDFAYWFHAPPVQAPVRVRVDFLGGPDTPNFGFLHRFGVSLDGQDPTAYWWDRTGTRGAARGCVALADTTMRSRGGPATIRFHPDGLDVQVHMTITTTGERDCSGVPSTGLGDVVFDGSFTREQLFSGEPLVLETGPDVVVPLRITVEVLRGWTVAR